MKKLILVTLCMVFASVTAFAEIGIITMRDIGKYVTGTKGIALAKSISGPMTIRSDATCSVFMNATTMARTLTATGYPLVANTEYKYNVNPTAHLSFTCASSATVKNVYIVR